MAYRIITDKERYYKELAGDAEEKIQYEHSSEIDEMFVPHLHEDEYIVWSGESEKGTLRERGVCLTTLAPPVIMLVVSVFITIYLRLTNPLFMWFPALFAIVYLKRIFKLFFRKKTYYALTNCRVMRAKGKKFSSELLYDLFNIECYSSKRDKGYICYSYERSVHGKLRRSLRGIYCIKNPKEIRRLIKEISGL